MKNKFLGLFVFLFALVGVVSCDIEPLDRGLEPDSVDNVRPLFSVAIDGTYYTTRNVTALVENGKLVVTAKKGDEIFILKSNGVIVGTYTNSQLEFAYIESEDTFPYLNVNPVTGQNSSTLSVTAINFEQERITGTFEFTGYRLKESEENPTVEQIIFYEGIFENVPYEVENED